MLLLKKAVYGIAALSLLSALGCTTETLDVTHPEDAGADVSPTPDADLTPDTAPDTDPDPRPDADSTPDADPTPDTDPTPDADPPTPTECNDGIDNDGDGLVDWQYDLGCSGPNDTTEAALDREEEDGWTTFDPAPDTRIFYVSSSEGDDDNDGLSPETAIATLEKGLSLLRDGQPDWLLLKRGDTWYEKLQWSDRSGKNADERMIVATYGESTQRPVLKTGAESALILNDASHVAFLDLDFYAHTRDPASPEHVGSAGSSGIYRCCNYVENILWEGLRTRYYASNVLNTSDGQPANFEFRRNVVVDNYPVFPDGGHSQGIYTAGIHGLLIEENVFDLNGWDPNIEGAEATIFNHNMYINSGSDLVMRGNLSLRSSSLGVKMNANATNGYVGVVIEDNFIYDAEVGISIGGNTELPSRFVDVEVINNVFHSMGRSNQTGRNFGWQIEIKDHRNSLVSGNYFLHQPWYGNAFGVGIEGDSNENLTVSENFFYNLTTRAFTVSAAPGWDNVRVTNNNIQIGTQETAMIRHLGPLHDVTYADNTYWSAAASDEWFSIDHSGRSYEQWLAFSGEEGSVIEEQSFADPDRGVEEYQASLGREATIDAFLEDARQQSKYDWHPEYGAYELNAYFRAGFQ